MVYGCWLGPGCQSFIIVITAIPTTVPAGSGLLTELTVLQIGILFNVASHS